MSSSHKRSPLIAPPFVQPYPQHGHDPTYKQYNATLCGSSQGYYKILCCCARQAKAPSLQCLAFVEFLAFNLNNEDDQDSLTETNALLQVPNLLDQVESARQEYQKGEALTMQQVFG